MMTTIKNTLRPVYHLVKKLNIKKALYQRKALKNRREVEEIYRSRIPKTLNHPQDPVLLCEGMWDNPNHWYRLHLFIQAAAKLQKFRLIGILRRRTDLLQKQSLESLGVMDIRYLEDGAGDNARFEKQADALLKDVRDHRDLLNLKLPDDLPAYTYYDTVLKRTRSPQPEVTSASWREHLIRQLQNSEFYRHLFEKENIWSVVSSHPWESEFSTLCWTALTRNVPFYYLNGMCESIRIRRMSGRADYAFPHEFLKREEYEALPEDHRKRLIQRAEDHLQERFSAQSTDINIRYAFQPEKRLQDCRAIRQLMGAPMDKPLVVLYASVWFDFPHCCGMRQFTDFLDWIQFTLKAMRENADVTWVLRPHPTEPWYAGTKLSQIAGKDLPKHIILYDKPMDSLSMQSAADAILTIHGTITTEAVARGTPALCADRSYFSDWDYTHTASSREDYRQQLLNMARIAKPTDEQRERAMVFGATAIGKPPADLPHLCMPDDSLQNEIYFDRPTHLIRDLNQIDNEINEIAHWLKEGHHSYNVYRILNATAADLERPTSMPEVSLAR